MDAQEAVRTLAIGLARGYVTTTATALVTANVLHPVALVALAVVLLLAKELAIELALAAQVLCRTKRGDKMRKHIVIKIDSEDSNLVERKYFEHAAGKDNLQFLMRDAEVNMRILQQYIDIVEKRFYELEKCKKYISDKYCPEELKGKSYDYSFDFDEETITYEEIA